MMFKGIIQNQLSTLLLNIKQRLRPSLIFTQKSGFSLVYYYLLKMLALTSELMNLMHVLRNWPQIVAMLVLLNIIICLIIMGFLIQCLVVIREVYQTKRIISTWVLMV